MIKKNELYEITIVRTNINHYKQFFPNINYFDKIFVSGEQLSSQSHQKIKYICDYCGKEFERTKGSQNRNGVFLNKDACKDCRSKKTKESCLIKYGVSSPMKVPEIHQKSVKNHKNNFKDEKSSFTFINGIPASKAQIKLQEVFPSFSLNVEEDGYYYDLFDSKKKIVIEYNGRGHDLVVRIGKTTKEVFKQREEKRKDKILEKYSLLVIEDKYDRLLKKKHFSETIPKICQFLESGKSYDTILVE